MAERINSYKELRVYQHAMDLAMEIFHLTKSFPKEEKYSLVDQIRRASRSVCTNLAEGWRKRRYKAAFIAKLSDAETEACETQVWIEFSKRCEYLNEETALRSPFTQNARFRQASARYVQAFSTLFLLP